MPKLFHLCDPEDNVEVNDLEATVTNHDGGRFTIKVPMKGFFIDDVQRKAIQALYQNNSPQITRTQYGDTPLSQSRAQSFLQYHKLDRTSLEQLESRWTVSWSNKWMSGKLHKKRVLYQCSCGYNTEARQRRSKSTSAEQWSRHAAYDFTGCCVHADVTYIDAMGAAVVTRIIGFFEHNESCKNGVLMRFPAIPLHEHVYEVALAMLAQGASVASIQSENVTRVEQKLYRDQTSKTPETANHRYELLPGDFSRLYRRYYRLQGVDVDVQPEYNVDHWMDNTHSHFNRTIFEAVFYYGARAEKDEHFELCIASTEMKAAAWKYVHKKQLILDGTFGLCTARLLLWIAMGVDENNHGIPVALFLFSAPTGTKATHAGYDTRVLAKLLLKWKGSFGVQNGVLFGPSVTITDTDTKERGALIQTWPTIKLLLCKFHLRQCWTNKREGLLGKGGIDFFKSHVESRLRTLEQAMLTSMSREQTLLLIDSEQAVFKQLCTSPQSTKAGQAGLLYLTYLQNTWMPPDLWDSWSCKGRNDAALLLGIDVKGVLPTTNHLESFNGVLKRKHITQWQHSGRRLRFDILIYRLIIHILPNIYAQHRMINSFQAWKADRFQDAAGGRLLTPHSPHKKTSQAVLSELPMAWYESDATRDGFAQDFVRLGRLVSIESKRMYELWATCAATGADMQDPLYMRYWLTIHPSGSATCTCLDWIKRGGACKHLRAFRLIVEGWGTAGKLPYKYHFPQTQKEAMDIHAQNHLWYGTSYDDAVTSPAASVDSAIPRPSTPELLRIDPSHIPLQPINAPLPSVEQHARLEVDIESISNMPQDIALEAKYLGVNQRAIETQIQQRFQHHIAQTLPILHGLNTLLDDSSPLPTTENLTDFVLTLGNLFDCLQGLAISPEVQFDDCQNIGAVQLTPMKQHTSQHVLPSTPIKRTRHIPPSESMPIPSTPIPSTPIKRSAVLPPSPEGKVQKRKKSYNTI